MTRWRPIAEDLEMTEKRPAGNLEMHRRFVELNGITEWAFVPNRADQIPYILRDGRFPAGYRRYPMEGFDYGPPPGLDHGRLYRGKEHKGAALVWHPYQDPADVWTQLIDWAKAAGVVLLAMGKDRSWYYPGGTYLLAAASAWKELRIPPVEVSLERSVL